MSPIQSNNPINSANTGTPLYTYGNNTQSYALPNNQTVGVSSPNTSQIYQYPATSLYEPSKQAASGVNIYIYNPSGIGGPSSTSNANATYALPGANQQQTVPAAQNVAPQQTMSIANTPISAEAPQAAGTAATTNKTKNIVELTDDYIKTLENYLRSPDANIRKSAITELIKRYEEDESRYDDPALTALLNIALQDPDAANRMQAMSPIAAGSAHGDANTVEILKNLQTSDKVYGQEAKMANDALLNAVQTKVTVPDNSPEPEPQSQNQ